MGDVVAPVMKAGFYNDHSQFQRDAVVRAAAILQTAAAAVPLREGAPLTLLDCGCSQGRNSVEAVKIVLEALRARLRQKPAVASAPLDVMVIHEDLPDNDFTSLMRAVYDPDTGYVRDSTVPDNTAGLDDAAAPLRVFSGCVGRSMYEPLLPDGTVGLVMAFNCLHWLGRKAAAPRDSLFSFLSRDQAVLRAFEDEFRRGFSRFLHQRARECVTGAHLLFCLPVHARGADPTIMDTINGAAVAMVADGELTCDDLAEMCNHDYPPPPGVVRDVLAAAAGEWVVHSSELSQVVHPAWTAFKAGELSEEEAAAAYTSFTRAVSEPYLIGTLTRRRGAATAAAAAVSSLYERVHAAYVRAPQPIAQVYLYAALVRA